MPEGDTVWRTARRLAPLSGQLLNRSDFRVPSLATADLAGHRVLETVSRGKHLLTRLEDDLTLHSHLGMEGLWTLHPVGARWSRPAHQARVVLGTDRQEAVGFSVQLDLVATGEEHQLVGHLGPDLLGTDWDQAEVVRRLRADPDVSIGEALLDQHNLAEIGNVYKAELCFLAGVDPRTQVGAVPDLERLVRRARSLLVANRDRASRITTGECRRGRHLWVYGRRGPCLRCGGGIRHEHLGEPGRERITWWCPACQPARPRDA